VKDGRSEGAKDGRSEGRQERSDDQIPYYITITSNLPLVASLLASPNPFPHRSFSRVPYEVVKQKLQTGVYPTTAVALSSMWSKGGISEFFPKGGVGIQMCRDIPYAVFTLITYELLQEKWVRRDVEDGDKPPAWRNMIAGAVAGGVGSFLTNPMDVVKTRIQTDPTVYKGILDCARRTLSEEGVGAFGRGCGARLCHKIPANGLFFINYEFFRRVLGVEGGKNL